MPLNTIPGATALLYARNKATGETYFVGPSTPGPPYVIVGDFGEQHTPADLPVDGAIPADWDAVGDQAHQMVLGEGLVYSPFDMTVPDAGYLFSFVGTANPTGWVRAGRVVGETGATGISSVIVGDFGATTTPADLPPTGAIPVDWDGPGNPSVAYQMEIGQSLYYNKPGGGTAIKGEVHPGDVFAAESVIVGEDQANADLLSGLGYVPFSTSPPYLMAWLIGESFLVGTFRFYWNGARWEPGQYPSIVKTAVAPGDQTNTVATSIYNEDSVGADLLVATGWQPVGGTAAATWATGEYFLIEGQFKYYWDGSVRGWEPGASAVVADPPLGGSPTATVPDPRAADPLNGHLFQYVGTSIDASGWLDIGLIQGPAGPAGPQGVQGDPGPSLAPSVSIPAVLVNGFIGSLVFRVNGAAVTMSLNNVQRSSVHGDGQIKICDYPAGVAAPVEVQQVLNHGMFVKSNGYIDKHTENFVLVRARPDGVFLAIMSNVADFGTTEALNCQMTWVL